MKTNRDKLLQDAFVMFLQYNYERASYKMLTQATGLSKAGMAYYYPSKTELFVAVADRFFFNEQRAEAKFGKADTLRDFIDRFVANVRHTMESLVQLMKRVEGHDGLAPQAHYFNFLTQIRRYYPNVEHKLDAIFSGLYHNWREAIKSAKDSGEIRPDTDADNAAGMMVDIYLGLSFASSFFNGLDVEVLRNKLYYAYGLIKS